LDPTEDPQTLILSIPSVSRAVRGLLKVHSHLVLRTLVWSPLNFLLS
jgi:hypothetical protein